MSLSEQFLKAADAVKSAQAMVVTAGAGMGVDSGLPDFRGDQGFWNAYPMYERLGINFVGAANPANFEGDPAFGWGFYGHRTNLYRETEASGAPEIGNPDENGFGSLQQGFLEMSNVKVVEEMINMIVAQRAYEINSKAIQASDEMMAIVNQVKR